MRTASFLPFLPTFLTKCNLVQPLIGCQGGGPIHITADNLNMFGKALIESNGVEVMKEYTYNGCGGGAGGSVSSFYFLFSCFILDQICCFREKKENDYTRILYFIFYFYFYFWIFIFIFNICWKGRRYGLKYLLGLGLNLNVGLLLTVPISFLNSGCEETTEKIRN